MLADKNWLSTNMQSHSEISIVTGKDMFCQTSKVRLIHIKHIKSIIVK